MDLTFVREFDGCFVTTTPAVAACLLEKSKPRWGEAISSTRMLPAWVAVITMAERVSVPYDAAQVQVRQSA